MKLLQFFLFLHQIHPTLYELVSEYQALLSVKAAITDDPQLAFTRSTWNASTSHCTWTHVTCDSRHSVTTLYLWNLNLSGTLSPDLAQLHFLSNLSVSQNRLSGQIPTELGSLVSLKFMDLSANMLTGEIPFSLEKENVVHIYGTTLFNC